MGRKKNRKYDNVEAIVKLGSNNNNIKVLFWKNRCCLRAIKGEEEKNKIKIEEVCDIFIIKKPHCLYLAVKAIVEELAFAKVLNSIEDRKLFNKFVRHKQFLINQAF